MATPDTTPWSERLVAHRGLAARFPENTLASVAGALAAGARRVEIDVQLTADRVPVLMHDTSLERMCALRRDVHDLVLRELRALRASEPGRFGASFADEPIATLAEFAALVAAAGAHAYVELKRASIERFGPDAVLEAIADPLRALAGSCTLISFDVDVLRRARKRLPHPVGPVLIDWAQVESGELEPLEPGVIFCDDRKLPAGPVRASAGLCVYEVDRAERARELVERGVRWIETFHVDRMLKELA